MAALRRRCPCLRPQETEVRVLDYRHNGLEHVPPEVFMFERTLEELYVDANQIKDLPRELFCCHSLRKLCVSDNELRTLPHAIGSLVHLEEMDISKNGIVSLPDNIKLCKLLSQVEASVNPLGKLPEGFTQLQALTELYLNDTFLDYLPGSFGRLSKLKILEIRENHLRTLPQSIERLTELERLDLGNNEFTELPDALGSLTKLWELWLDQNQLTKLPPCIGQLRQLTFLDASKNRLTSIPGEIEGCHALADLHLTTNLLRHLPDSIGRLSNLTTLKVDDNRLVTLPFSIGGLVSLSELNVSGNDLEELPPSIGFLRHLRTLYIDENYLIEIPSELGSCSGITVLSMRSNNLRFIPDEIGRIPRLRVLNLSDNKLNHLPYSLTRLKELQALWLAENQSTPLVRLQSDVDRLTGQRILTCYLLPQQTHKEQQQEEQCDDNNSFHPSLWEEERLKRQQIHFDFPDISDQEGKLERTPTPYPKEMKHRLQHMRNLALKQLNQPVPASNPSPVKEGRRAERERRSHEGNSPAVAGATSPITQERHHLLKADKEKLAKDKERLKHRPNGQEGQDNDDGGFLSGPTSRLRPSNSDVQQMFSPTRQIYYSQHRGASLPQSHQPRRPLPQMGSRGGRGYDSDTGYRSDFEMYRRRKNNMRTEAYDGSASAYNYPAPKPHRTRSTGYSSDAEVYSHRAHQQYRPLQGYRQHMRHSHQNIAMGQYQQNHAPYSNAHDNGRTHLANDEMYEQKQPLLPPHGVKTTESQTRGSVYSASGGQQGAPQVEQHSLARSDRSSVHKGSQQSVQTGSQYGSKSKLQGREGSAERSLGSYQGSQQGDQASSLNRSYHSLASEASVRSPPSQASMLSSREATLAQSVTSVNRDSPARSDRPRSGSQESHRSGSQESHRSGSHDSHQSGSRERPWLGSHDRPRSGSHDRPRSGSHDRPQSGSQDYSSSQALHSPDGQQKSLPQDFTRLSLNGSRGRLDESGQPGDDSDDAYKAQLQRAAARLSKSPSDSRSNLQLSSGNTSQRPPPYKPTPPYTPQVKASPGPAAVSTPNLESRDSVSSQEGMALPLQGAADADQASTCLTRQPVELSVNGGSPGFTPIRTSRQLFHEGAGQQQTRSSLAGSDGGWESGTFDRDVAMYKQEPPSQVSSTDSGYDHGQMERTHDFRPKYPDVPETEQTLESSKPLVVDTQQPPDTPHGMSLLTSRESTPGKSPGDSGMGSDAEVNHKKSQVFSVQLHKNPGLGFSIAGGVGATGNPFRPDDTGIFVTTVQPKGAANGVLRPGDKILQVNDANFGSIDHDSAVHVLRSTGQVVSVIIERW